MKSLKAILRILAVALITLSLLPFLFIARAISRQAEQTIIMIWHRNVLTILNVRLAIKGVCSTEPATLFVANHVSYLDIIAISAMLKTSFVSKKEIRRWPVFGWLSTLQRTVFIDRESRDVKGQMGDLAARLSNQESLVLFPEGTSTDGVDVKRFKSSLFAVKDLLPELMVQGVALRYDNLDGTPLAQPRRDHYAFYDTMPFAGHFWSMCEDEGVQITIEFVEGYVVNHETDRKALAQTLQQGIRKAVVHSPVTH